jgi:hypothetical protein
MDLSFGKPAAPARPPSQRRPPGSIDMSLGPAMKGALNAAPRSDIEGEEGGPDWRNALSQWVAQHAFYPPQAARDGEEGDAKVRVRADRNGRVREVELIGKSGSKWLDLALVALFRDARIPPWPPGSDEPIEFNFTMHYILIRGR